MNTHPCKRTQFRRGQSGNPGGLKKGEIAKKTLKCFTQAEIANIYRRLIDLSPKELKDFLKLKNISIIQHIVAKALLTDIQRGEVLNTEKILDRIIGKASQTSELSGKDCLPFIPPVIQFVSAATVEDG